MHAAMHVDAARASGSIPWSLPKDTSKSTADDGAFLLTQSRSFLVTSLKISWLFWLDIVVSEEEVVVVVRLLWIRAPLLDDDEDEVKLLDSFLCNCRHTATEFNLLIVADMMTTTREKDTSFIYTGLASELWWTFVTMRFFFVSFFVFFYLEERRSAL